MEQEDQRASGCWGMLGLEDSDADGVAVTKRDLFVSFSDAWDGFVVDFGQRVKTCLKSLSHCENVRSWGRKLNFLDELSCINSVDRGCSLHSAYLCEFRIGLAQL